MTAPRLSPRIWALSAAIGAFAAGFSAGVAMVVDTDPIVTGVLVALSLLNVWRCFGSLRRVPDREGQP